MNYMNYTAMNYKTVSHMEMNYIAMCFAHGVSNRVTNRVVNNHWLSQPSTKRSPFRFLSAEKFSPVSARTTQNRTRSKDLHRQNA